MEKYVISLGGSLIAPNGVDTSFVKGFIEAVEEFANRGDRFYVVCGGGKLARDYQNAADRLGNVTDSDKDWLGIKATELNALFLHQGFDKGLVYRRVLGNPDDTTSVENKVIVCCGYRLGRSTDYIAVKTAISNKITRVINMSNISHVYDRDPSNNPDAIPYDNLNWNDYLRIIGDKTKWAPGMSSPFDFVASGMAQRNGLEVCFIGRDLENLRNLLMAKKFKGTIIRD